jgi:hypothetical protein
LIIIPFIILRATARTHQNHHPRKKRGFLAIILLPFFTFFPLIPAVTASQHNKMGWGPWARLSCMTGGWFLSVTAASSRRKKYQHTNKKRRSTTLYLLFFHPKQERGALFHATRETKDDGRPFPRLIIILRRRRTHRRTRLPPSVRPSVEK